MDLIKEIANCRNKDNPEVGNLEIIKVLKNFVREATPYPKDLSEEELRGIMIENGVMDIQKIDNMLFAINEYGMVDVFRFSITDFYLKCHNNRMVGIFDDEKT